MKKLIILLAAMMSGCTLVDAYLMTKYDPNEYGMITEIRTTAHIYADLCADPAVAKQNAITLFYHTNLFATYAEYIPHNDSGLDAAKNLNEIAQGLSAKYQAGEKVSPAFCRIKFESVENSAKLMQSVIGKRPR